MDSRLVLGCAQLGMHYGVSNVTGQPSIQESVNIVATAWNRGIQCFDTARCYGESELVLGTCFRFLNIKPKVITKYKNTEDIDRDVDLSLNVLGIDKLYGVLLHDETCLWDYEAMTTVEDRVDNIGVSVYDIKRAKLVNRAGMMIQLPFNLLDQRLLDYNFSGRNLFIRSVYLQGVLSGSVIAEAMAFVTQRAPKDSKIVVGVETLEQLVNTIQLYNSSNDYELGDTDKLRIDDPNIINPSLWGG